MIVFPLGFSYLVIIGLFTFLLLPTKSLKELKKWVLPLAQHCGSQDWLPHKPEGESGFKSHEGMEETKQSQFSHSLDSSNKKEPFKTLLFATKERISRTGRNLRGHLVHFTGEEIEAHRG